MNRSRIFRFLLTTGGACALVALATMPALAQQYDSSYDSNAGYSQAQNDSAQSPGRVARLAYTSGDVQFAPAGEDSWGSIDINRPMVIGDRLVTGDSGRAALELGDASVRIDRNSAFDFLNLAQDNVQIELSQGTLNLAVRNLDSSENFEVDTPTVAFVATQPGIYRIDDAPDGNGSMVTVFRGAGTVYGENGASRQVQAGTSYRFNDSALASVDVTGLPQPDDFDRFCEARDASYNRYAQAQQRFVPPDMIGSEDLSQYGQWNDTPEYGNVWYPQVAANWAPYRDGHWAWIDPWGWTWVDNAPWGFAPFHYGRWVYVRNRWGWMPGGVRVRPTYAPALVAFIGGAGLSVSVRIGGGGPVGWFPLGPRDVYVPWFHASRRYFDNVNVTNIRNVYVNKTIINNVYNDYSTNKIVNINRYNRYAYRDQTRAVTMVPRNVFTGARQVRTAVLRTNGTQLARGNVMVRPAVVPGRDSLGLRRPVARPAVIREQAAFKRPVVARRAPPPRPVPFAAREKIIAQQHGAPVSAIQMRQLRAQQPATTQRSERVKLIPAAALVGGAAALAARRNGTRPGTPAQPERATPVRPNDGRFHNQIHPIPANGQLHPVPVTRPQPERNTTRQRPNELPSARFRHPAPQPQSTGRLPVVRPVEPAPGNRLQQERAREQQAQQQRQTQVQARQQAQMRQREAQMQAQQQRAREQQAQQQRQTQVQARQQAQVRQREAQMQAQQQRAREQQAQQQRQTQMQAQQQRAREQQVQQQRQAQMQAQQRAREQQAQQQRQAQMQAQQQSQMRQREAQMRAQQQRAREQQPRYNAPQNRERPTHERKEPKQSSDNNGQPWR